MTKTTLARPRAWSWMAMTMVVAVATPARAQDLNAIGTTILAELNSTFLQAIAAVALIGIAICWMIGVVRPITALVSCIGIGVAAAGPAIASRFFGS